MKLAVRCPPFGTRAYHRDDNEEDAGMSPVWGRKVRQHKRHALHPRTIGANKSRNQLPAGPPFYQATGSSNCISVMTPAEISLSGLASLRDNADADRGPRQWRGAG